MTNKRRVVNNAMEQMRDFIAGEGKPPEAYDRFFRKLFNAVYHEAWLHGTQG